MLIRPIIGSKEAVGCLDEVGKTHVSVVPIADRWRPRLAAPIDLLKSSSDAGEVQCDFCDRLIGAASTAGRDGWEIAGAERFECACVSGVSLSKILSIETHGPWIGTKRQLLKERRAVGRIHEHGTDPCRRT